MTVDEPRPPAGSSAFASVAESLRAAVVSIDPRTGGIRAYYGGEDGVGFDRATAALQTGSSFKVFALVAALEQGYTLASRYDSSPLTVNGVTVGNVGGETCGSCNIAQALKLKDHDAYRLHRTVTRPWGTYTVLEEGPGLKIKRIVVKPQGALSLQMHRQRSEHWIVVSGIAQVTNGDRQFELNTNESTFIKPGRAHRLVNPGSVDLVMIEVQSGEYVGEDDIVRLSDIYGRVPVGR